MSPLYLLEAVIESLVDGILIFTDRYELVHANECARRICPQLLQGGQTNGVIEEVQIVCQSLLDSRDLFPAADIIMESEIATEQAGKLRIRARWLELSMSERVFMLVTLEDCARTSQNLALCEAKKYHLTAREAEVWSLRQAHHSYKEIAAKLYITINTVKKHLKNIHAKQQQTLSSQ